jgi:hypothetical protein
MTQEQIVNRSVGDDRDNAVIAFSRVVQLPGARIFLGSVRRKRSRLLLTAGITEMAQDRTNRSNTGERRCPGPDKMKRPSPGAV